MRHITASGVCCYGLALLCGAQPLTAMSSDFHDFDFAIGDFGTRILHLQHMPGRPDDWTVWTGRVMAAKVWGGRANIQEIEVSTPSGPIEELRLCLFQPRLRQWYLYWADSSDGALAKPMIGGFHGGAGRFYDQEYYKNRAIFVRDLYSQITPQSYHWQQAFSSDGGTTWAPNWNVTLTLQSFQAAPPPQVQRPSAVTDSQAHAFDFVRGDWRTDTQGRVTVRRIWGGQADLEEMATEGLHGPREELTLRLYDPTARQWNLYRANSADGVLEGPLIGGFKDGRGVFYDQDTNADHTVFVRDVYSDIAADSYRFEQAVSDDGGRTWRTDFTTHLTRVGR
jgi:hypothetical protein